MLLGIISDTHGHVERTRRAAERLAEASVEEVVHCGDIGSEAVLAELATTFSPLEIPVTAVLGNVDVYGTDLTLFPSSTGIRVAGRIAKLEWENLRAVVLHGDDFRALGNAVDSEEYDYVFTGHTHVAADERRGRTRIVNPGAVYRATEPSVATLDLGSGSLTVLSL